MEWECLNNLGTNYLGEKFIGYRCGDKSVYIFRDKEGFYDVQPSFPKLPQTILFQAKLILSNV